MLFICSFFMIDRTCTLEHMLVLQLFFNTLLSSKPKRTCMNHSYFNTCNCDNAWEYNSTTLSHGICIYNTCLYLSIIPCTNILIITMPSYIYSKSYESKLLSSFQFNRQVIYLTKLHESSNQQIDITLLRHDSNSFELSIPIDIITQVKTDSLIFYLS